MTSGMGADQAPLDVPPEIPIQQEPAHPMPVLPGNGGTEPQPMPVTPGNGAAAQQPALEPA